MCVGSMIFFSLRFMVVLSFVSNSNASFSFIQSRFCPNKISTEFENVSVCVCVWRKTSWKIMAAVLLFRMIKWRCILSLCETPSKKIKCIISSQFVCAAWKGRAKFTYTLHEGLGLYFDVISFSQIAFMFVYDVWWEKICDRMVWTFDWTHTCTRMKKKTNRVCFLLSKLK